MTSVKKIENSNPPSPHLQAKVWINSSHFTICEAASKMSSKLQSSIDSLGKKLQSVIYSSYEGKLNFFSQLIGEHHM